MALESERYDNIAEFIEANPDTWTTTDGEYEDEDLISALKIAADALRRNYIESRIPRLAGWCTRCGGECFDPGPRHRCPRRLRDYPDEQIKSEYARRFGRDKMLEKPPEGGTHYGTPE